MQRPQFLLHKRHLSEFPFKVDLLSNSMQLTLISYEYTYVHPLSLRSFYATPPGPVPGSLRKHPFLLALRREGTYVEHGGGCGCRHPRPNSKTRNSIVILSHQNGQCKQENI